MEERLLAMEDTSTQNIDPRAKKAPHLASKARPVPYQLVIPTYQRWMPVNEMSKKRRFKKCKSPFILMHSLAFLSRQRIPKHRVTLFVANSQELAKYRKALQGSDWADVRIEISVLGNKNSRNFIMKFFPAGTYVVSLDDDVERISWKCREGMTEHVLRAVPPGGFEKIIFDAYKVMGANKAYLWGLSTSQNARHMNIEKVSVRNGLVNGYLNGYISRPQCKELFRTLSDATEDSEFSVRHYAKDGILIRYRMYAGITSPYINRGGLQKKFELKGERITAEQRSAARKQEERWGAAELQKLFPRLIGPPQVRRDKKTMEVNFYSWGCPPGELSKRKRIAPQLMDTDRIRYVQKNPKLPGSHAHKLYERYKHARTLSEAVRLGARPIDLAHDYNWGFLSVVGLSTSVSYEVELKAEDTNALSAGRRKAPKLTLAAVEEKFVKVRVKEMSLGHSGLDVKRDELLQLAAKAPSLQQVPVEKFAEEDGPLSTVPLEILRGLLRWASTGRLRYQRKQTKGLHAALKALGLPNLAKQVKLREAQEARTDEVSGSKSSAKQVRASARRWLGKASSKRQVRSAMKAPKQIQVRKIAMKARR